MIRPIDEFDDFFVIDDIKGFPKKFFTEGKTLQ